MNGTNCHKWSLKQRRSVLSRIDRIDTGKMWAFTADRLQLQVHQQLECGPMPNVTVALPNIGGALCSTPQSLADVYY